MDAYDRFDFIYAFVRICLKIVSALSLQVTGLLLVFCAWWWAGGGPRWKSEIEDRPTLLSQTGWLCVIYVCSGWLLLLGVGLFTLHVYTS